ncbi:response regulator transcription factor [Clostridium tagluense]|uniref:response regulator transcription factor n=1 Tax=Clostridium TaxID=1485 RepID=UPI0013E93D13|nr:MULTISPECIES: response regulator transcription factor [Clostridium]MBU3127550.1 response regulator transcription factor [Clostridium tagluense]MBZ9621922.1 response regulator transcription factor [Clostridium sp. FP2]MCB2314041.1 response regulator transcription factor [Clostridium tagluense]MCB2318873.1 response regulator transcription factor [Clostridium tagluense]MCB2323768.1 response regulator transcription factor [Clostridium tagluense]
MNILIADDEKQMVKILSAYFQKEGFNTITAVDGAEALDLFHLHKIDLAILDWMMPKVSGVEVCKYIKQNSNTKVLILTAKTQNEDEIKALNCGADEYIKKPFDPRILLIRAKKLINISDVININDIKINTDEQRVYKNGEALKLTKIEYDLLISFVRNKGIILSRDRLIDLVWGMDYEGDYRTVDTHIRRLRSKIGEDSIKTYRRLGYSMEADEN